MLRQSVEGMRRLQFGFKGKVGGIHTNGVEPVLGEGDISAGARTALRTDDKGIEHTIILPQVGGRHSKENTFEWCLEQDLTVEWASKFPKGSEFHIIGGENDADSERLMKKWLSVCPTFQYGGQLERPSTEDGRVMIHVDHQHNPTTIRCLCKFVFNYMALIKGPDFALSPSFDSLRAFIRYDQGGAGAICSSNRSRSSPRKLFVLNAGRTATFSPSRDGQRPIVEGQVALFNSIPIPDTRCAATIRGEWFAKGHHFHTEDWTASE